jgi:OOP family OmpA-OmpF porin
MTTNSSIKGRAITTIMIALFLLVTGICSFIQAQSVFQVANADRKVNIGSVIDQDSKAETLQHSINSPYEELKPVLAPGGNRLYFSRSANPNNTSGVEDNEDIWYSEVDKTNNTWSEPVRMPGLLNNAGPNYINNVSITGDTIILGNQYLKKGKMRAGLSYSVNVSGQWTAPLPIHIQNDYNVSDHANAFVSLKNGVIISAIQRAETVGERDLYVSFWNGVEATEPVNMGSVINTDQEESSPYLAADNKTLYFASKGHSGFGGYDIFVTRRLDESWTNWSKPENLGPAVNGALDDEFFSLTPCGQFAIFSKRVTVHNVDLFKISLNGLNFEQINKSSTRETFAAL